MKIDNSIFFKIRLPIDLLDKISSIAKQDNKTVSQVIRDILIMNIDK